MIPYIRDALKVILFSLDDRRWASEANTQPFLLGAGMGIAVAHSCHLKTLMCVSLENVKTFYVGLWLQVPL